MALDLAKLREQLRLEEGDVRHPYKDPTGNTTIGVGHNLDAQPLSDAVVDLLLTEDLADVCHDLDRTCPWWRTLDEVRARVVADMVFNMGIGTFLTLTSLITHVKAREFDAAADRMLHFKWAQQVGLRATKLAQMMRTGQEPTT